MLPGRGREDEALSGTPLLPPQRAEPPRAPASSAAMRKAGEERTDYLRKREARERRSIVRGLALLAIIALLISVYRAGLSRVFFTGWWRQW